MEDQLQLEEHKEQLKKVLEAALVWQTQQKNSFDFLSLTSKHLYTMVESIAEKEIQKDPIDFIRRESFQVGGDEEFFSFDGDDVQVQRILENEDEDDEDDDDEEEEEAPAHDEEDDENEYHEEEKAVAKIMRNYKDDTMDSRVITSDRGLNMLKDSDALVVHAGMTAHGEERKFQTAKEHMIAG